MPNLPPEHLRRAVDAYRATLAQRRPIVVEEPETEEEEEGEEPGGRT